MIQKSKEFGKWIRPRWWIVAVLAVALAISTEFAPYYLCGTRLAEVSRVVQVINQVEEVLAQTGLLLLVIGLTTWPLTFIQLDAWRIRRTAVRIIAVGVILLLVTRSGFHSVAFPCL